MVPIAGMKRPYSSISENVASTRTSARLPTPKNWPTPNAPSTSPSVQMQSHSVTPEASGLAADLNGRKREFDPEASIVLVGARGTGKSTLGVIAGTVCRRQHIDTDFSFKERTGLSPSAFRKTKGAVEYQRQSLEVLEMVLEKNAKNCVIVVNGTLNRDGQNLLAAYSATHPVILILRDVSSIQEYLNAPEKEKISELVDVSERVLRACSNFEFFNLSETSSIGASKSPELEAIPKSSPSPYLALKYAEQHFLKFLSSATRIAKIPAMEDTCPLSRVNVEQLVFTYMISISLSDITSKLYDIERLEQGADAFELRVNSVLSQQNGTVTPHSPGSVKITGITQAFARIRRSIIIPMVYHVELESVLDSSKVGLARFSSYLELVHHGLRLAPEFVTLDLTLSDEVLHEVLRHKASTRAIAHCYTSDEDKCDWNHSYWLDAYSRARRLGFDIVRLCWPAKFISDNFAVNHFKGKAASLAGPMIPIIAYNTGILGKTSRCFNPTMTPVTHRDISDRDTFAVTAPEATSALYKSFVFEPMRFYIMGASAGYSLSPAMHSAAYEVCGMPHTYQTLQTDTLNELRQLVQDDNFGGCSISLPFKLEVITLTHSLSKHAKAIGAINTLLPVRHLKEDGSIPDDLELFKERNRSGPIRALYGENTDWIGIRACVRRGLSPVNAVTNTTTALIIGAGGMARACVYAVLQLGVRNIFIHNRTPANAERLIAHFQRLVVTSNAGGAGRPLPIFDNGVHFEALNERDKDWPGNFRPPTIIVSCIPTHRIGENPSPEFVCPVQWLNSRTGGVVMELAYRNIRTPLMEQIRQMHSKGWVTMDGLDLLPEQGFAQFELFTGRRAPRRLMRYEILRNYRDDQNRPDPEYIQWRVDQCGSELLGA